jgi:hypothetical protein
MKTKLRIFISLLIGLMGMLPLNMEAASMHFSYSGNSYNTYETFYVALQDASGARLTNLDNCEIGVFVDGECRYSAYYTSTSVDNSNVWLCTLKAYGDANDKDKAVTFKAYYNNVEYLLTPTNSITFSGTDATYSAPSSPLAITFIPVTGIQINDGNPLSVTVGSSIALTVTTIPAVHTDFSTTPSVVWDFANSSSYIDVANNQLTGKVVTEDGSPAYLRATYGTFSASTSVSVTAANVAVTGIDYPDTTRYIVMNVGDVKTVGYSIVPQNATNKKVTMSIGNTDIISQSAAAANAIKGLAPGSTTVTITTEEGNHALVYHVIVKQPVTGITGTNLKLIAYEGDEVPLDYVVVPSNASDKSVTITSDNTSVVSISSGKAMAVKQGFATVTVTTNDGNNSVEYSVAVLKRITGITTTEKKDVYVCVGESKDITYAVEPEDASNYDVHLTMGEKGLFTIVDSTTTGVVKIQGVNVGTTTMTITTDDTDATGNHLSLVFNVHVMKQVESISMVSDTTINEFETCNLPNITYTPTDAYFVPENVNWFVSAPSQNFPSWDLTLSVSKGSNNGDMVESPGMKGYVTGKFQLNASYGSTNAYAVCNVTVTQPLKINSGWSWKSIYTDANYAVSNFSTVLESNFVEARSQEQLVYNDPQYKLFGDLSAMSKGQAYKINVKAGTDSHTFTLPLTKGTWECDATTYTLRKGWNWIGYPFEYNYPITDALSSQFQPADGDMIVAFDKFYTYNMSTKAWDGGSGTNDEQILNAGEGYMYYTKAENPGTLMWNAPSSLS